MGVAVASAGVAVAARVHGRFRDAVETAMPLPGSVEALLAPPVTPTAVVREAQAVPPRPPVATPPRVPPRHGGPD